MNRIIVLIAGLLLAASTATAGPNWHTNTFSTSPANAPKVLAAFDKLMGSLGGELTGSVSLMANVAGGATSHSVVSAFETRAEREAWLAHLRASPAWAEFAKSTSGLIQPGSSSRMNFVKSWGEEDPKDVFWEIFAFTVSDPAALGAALDALLASDDSKGFPGQVHLSAVAAAGLSPVTHLISVGYESEAEAETWNTSILTTQAWASYVEATTGSMTPAGSYMIRSIQTWTSNAD